MVSPQVLPTSTSSDQDAWKLFVFRKWREPLSTQELITQLKKEMARVAAGHPAIDALVRAGEIEAGLADSRSPEEGKIAAVVDHLAAVACGSLPPDKLRADATQLEQVQSPETIWCSHPEGFSYYGLHPLSFVDFARQYSAQLSRTTAIIGIRTIGPVLSAVVMAALRQYGKEAERITVRPQGEPYHRHTNFDPVQARWITAGLERAADFVIVDEGPGFSGSTFLSVARALEAAGVPASRIILVGSRPFELSTHAASVVGAGQTRQYRRYSIAQTIMPPADAPIYIGNGFWREKLYQNLPQWPACWTELERTKYLSGDGRYLLKFEGFGRFGQRSQQHHATLAEENFPPCASEFADGFARYEFIQGRPLCPQDLSAALLARIAAYCAFRMKNFPAHAADPETLSNMLRLNLNLELGIHSTPVTIPIEHPVYADCCMMPHEWLLTSGNQVVKCDAVGHAEGHLLPGPVDICWDLAGAITEWQLSDEQTEFFLEQYQKRSGDDPRSRMATYLLLYAVFRMAFCRMGATSMAPWREAKYLLKAFRGYLRLAQEYLKESTAAMPKDRSVRGSGH